MKEKKESFASRKKIFLENFPGFNVNKAKMVIKDSNFQALKVKYKVVRYGKPATGSSTVPYKMAGNE